MQKQTTQAGARRQAEIRIADLLPDPRETARSIHRQVVEIQQQMILSRSEELTQ